MTRMLHTRISDRNGNELGPSRPLRFCTRSRDNPWEIEITVDPANLPITIRHEVAREDGHALPAVAVFERLSYDETLSAEVPPERQPTELERIEAAQGLAALRIHASDASVTVVCVTVECEETACSVQIKIDFIDSPLLSCQIATRLGRPRPGHTRSIVRELDDLWKRAARSGLKDRLLQDLIAVIEPRARRLAAAQLARCGVPRGRREQLAEEAVQNLCVKALERHQQAREHSPGDFLNELSARMLNELNDLARRGYHLQAAEPQHHNEKTADGDHAAEIPQGQIGGLLAPETREPSPSILLAENLRALMREYWLKLDGYPRFRDWTECLLAVAEYQGEVPLERQREITRCPDRDEPNGVRKKFSEMKCDACRAWALCMAHDPQAMLQFARDETQVRRELFGDHGTEDFRRRARKIYEALLEFVNKCPQGFFPEA